MEASAGFEPEMSESKSEVLPLHYEAICLLFESGSRKWIRTTDTQIMILMFYR